jgi:hypothetical protein
MINILTWAICCPCTWNLLVCSVSQAVQEHLTSGTQGQSFNELSAVCLDEGRPIRQQFSKGSSVMLEGVQVCLNSQKCRHLIADENFFHLHWHAAQ